MSWKGEEQQRVVASQFQDPNAKPLAALKQHQHGKLTHVQDLRLAYSLNFQATDGYDSV
ncbi:hypothetical protein OP10G_1278 [Fimbriimonas ginsengisoli Gsoil 348]|uniref:Uncharacterized protein n=1 Tax=Fimbriimonas ginsengisoli Gsoil 348 TaxID=661478 RepID=A0A068NMG3_FIMGI|nr:hypothetical protein OP10G_1278 [Fimbriimonas ginsengisoli Gsoil 348]